MADQRIVKMVPDPEQPGESIEGTVAKITRVEEPFSYAYLEDGTVITSKSSIMEVVRVDGRWDKHGNPHYSITQNISLNVTTPPHLIKGRAS